MKKSLDECLEQYKFYSGMCCDAITNHETLTLQFYTDKLFSLIDYAERVYNVDLNDVELSEVF